MTIRPKVIKTISKKSVAHHIKDEDSESLPLREVFIYAALGFLVLSLAITLIDTYL